MSFWKSRPRKLAERMVKTAITFVMQSGQFGTTVLITEIWRIKNDLFMCILKEVFSLATLHFSSPYGEPTSIVFSFIHSPGPCQRSYDLQRNTTTCYGDRGSYYCVWRNYFQSKEKALVNIRIFHTALSASKPSHSRSPGICLFTWPFLRKPQSQN